MTTIFGPAAVMAATVAATADMVVALNTTLGNAHASDPNPRLVDRMPLLHHRENDSEPRRTTQTENLLYNTHFAWTTTTYFKALTYQEGEKKNLPYLERPWSGFGWPQ